jgi:hypothetical protein
MIRQRNLGRWQLVYKLSSFVKIGRKKISITLVRFCVFMALIMKNAIFWHVTPCSLKEIYKIYGDTIKIKN